MITLAQAKKAIELAEQKAQSLGAIVSIAIVDASGVLIASSRMDGAIAVSPRFAYTKAFSAGTIGAPTATLGEYSQPGKPYFGITSLFGGEITTIAGGQPIMIDGKLAGGIGVGGSMDVSQDDECAKAGQGAF